MTGGRRLSLAVLVSLVALGGWLRFRGIEFGLPGELRPDEGIYRGAVRTRILPVSYGPLAFSVLAAWLRVAHGAAGIFGAPAGALSFDEFLARADLVAPMQRGLSALFATLTIAVVYAIGCRARSRAAGLAGAAILACSFLAVRDAHFGTVDSAVAFSVALSAWLALRAEGLLGFALAGAAVGGSAALKYLPGALALPLAGAAATSEKRARVSRLAVAMGAVAIAFAAFAFETWMRPGDFVREMAFQASFGRTLGIGAALGRALTDWPSIAMGPIAGFASLAALAWMAAAGARGERILAAWAATYLAVLAIGRSSFLRHFVPMVPLLAALLGVATVRAASILRNPIPRGTAILAAAALFVFDPLVRSIELGTLLRRETTPQLVERFLRTELPAGAVVSSPMAQLAAMIGGDRLAPWDPPALSRASEWYLISVHHPVLGDLGALTDPQVLFPAYPPAEPVFTAESKSEGARFENVDLWFFPWTGFSPGMRGGPDLRVWRIRPSGDLRPPPTLRSTGDRLEIDVPRDEVPILFFMRTQRAGQAAVETWHLPPSIRSLDLSAIDATGRYRIRCCALYPSGVSDWSEATEVELPVTRAAPQSPPSAPSSR